MHDNDFAAFARLTPTQPAQSTEELAAELERLRVEADARFARLAGNRTQPGAPLIWCIDESHAALDIPLDPALRAQVADILTQGRAVNLVPGRRL